MKTSALIVAGFLIALLFTAGIGMDPAWAKIYEVGVFLRGVPSPV